jgi:prepilin-type N-terminal cleavage/methylation domain-containing protein
MSAGRTARGFTLTELAVVLAIVGLLLGSVMYTLSAQVDQRNFNETRKRLEEAKELLLAFAVANGRLPCPAVGSSGLEPQTPGNTGQCDQDGGVYANGFLPAAAIGFQPTDSSGIGIDSWGNRIRYSVAQYASNSTACSSPTSPAFTIATNLRTNGIACAPADFVVCGASAGTVAGTPPGTPPSCGLTAPVIANQTTVVAIVLSVGKNGATVSSPGADETENTNAGGVYVYHEPRPAGASGGEFDDMAAWIPVGVLYGRLIEAGVLP